MIKKDLVVKVSNEVEVSQQYVDKIIDSFIRIIKNALIRRERVNLRGFGTFKTKDRTARIGRNLKTGEKVSIPARRIVRFKASKELNEKIKEGR